MMMLTKKIAIGVIVMFATMQAFRPARNQSRTTLPTDITVTVAVPSTVAALLKSACYDCHSNNTVYRWYMNVQPVAWFMAHHVTKGKGQLNFSEFGSYSKRKQVGKLKAIAREVEQGEMPLCSYTLMHSSARLTSSEKTLLVNWADNLRNGVEKSN